MATGDGNDATELDSHADTICAGKNTLVWSRTGKRVNVYGFKGPENDTTTVEIGTALTAYTHPETLETYILVLNQALLFGSRMPKTLLSTNQMRYYGIRVDDAPLHCTAHRDSTHSILIQQQAGQVKIPLRLRGTISYIETRVPTREEIANCSDDNWITLSSDREWDPHDPAYEDMEERARSRAEMVDEYARNEKNRIILATRTQEDSYEERQLSNVSTCLSEPELYREISSINLDINGDSTVSERGHEIAGATTSKEGKKPPVSAEKLSRMWNIGLEQARKTVKVTTQKGVRIFTHPIERRLRTRQTHLKYPTLRTTVYSDTMFSTVKGIKGHSCGQVFATDFGFIDFKPMKSKSESGHKFEEFIQDFGIPAVLLTDGAAEEKGGAFGDAVKRYHIFHKLSEPYSPWQNRAEAAIRELKKGVSRKLRQTGAPKRLWAYCSDWVARVKQRTATELCDGDTPLQVLTGETVDISEEVQFDWYERVYFIDPSSFPETKHEMGRVLGVASRVGQAMTFNILKSNAQVVSRSSVFPIDKLEAQTDAFKERAKAFDEAIQKKIGDAVKETEVDPMLRMDIVDDDFQEILDDPYDTSKYDPEEPDAERPDVDDYTPEEFDGLIGAQVRMSKGAGFEPATVKSRKRDADGRPIGLRHSNPLLDSRVYEIEYPDGHVEEVAANVIADAIYSQVDSEGREHVILDEILEHRSDGNAIKKEKGYEITPTGTRRLVKTTKGWKLLVQWKDGTTSWEDLRNLKDDYPLQLAEYAVANKIADEPAFAWWVKHALKKRDRIIAKVKSRYWKRTHKFGIELPKTIPEAFEIDRRTGTDYWRKAIEKEMKNVGMAFEFLEDGQPVPVGYSHINLHWVFDIKFDTFARKARFVANGNETEPPASITYSSVVSRDSVRIILLLAALNDLDVLSADIQNAYLNAPTLEKYYFTAGIEFGAKAGCKVLIVRALYGLKGSGAAWRNHFAKMIYEELGYQASLADPDVWLRKAVKPDGTEYYEYLIVYVDDILCCSLDPKRTMDAIQETFTIKDGKVGPPETYLGAQIERYTLPNAPHVKAWAMSSDKYIREAVKEVERKLAEVDKQLKTNVTTPMPSGYRPEMDVTPELNGEQASYYQQLIGVLRWGVELGRLDVYIDVAQLSRFLCAPRRGHLEAIFHVFGYLKKYKRSRMVFDPTKPEIDDKRFVKADWSNFYRGAKEQLPPNAPPPRGNSVSTHCFVDADHAGCRVTRRSYTGIILFVNRAPIMWYSKRQNTVETSSFGSEMVALKIAVEMIEGLRYKLRMFGVPIDGETDIFCDNQSVVKNTSLPESALKKKHNAVAYHRIREACASRICRIAHEDGQTNLADMLTKSLPGPKLRTFIQRILW